MSVRAGTASGRRAESERNDAVSASGQSENRCSDAAFQQGLRNPSDDAGRGGVS